MYSQNHSIVTINLTWFSLGANKGRVQKTSCPSGGYTLKQMSKYHILKSFKTERIIEADTKLPPLVFGVYKKTGFYKILALVVATHRKKRDEGCEIFPTNINTFYILILLHIPI